MKATGIVRRIDDLGRIVIPKEIRRTLRIREGDPLEIFTSNDGQVIFKKYSPIGEISSSSEKLAAALNRQCGLPVVIFDRDHCISCAGISRREVIERRISSQCEDLMDNRGAFTANGGASLCPIEGMDTPALTVSTIVAAGDVIGAVAFLSGERTSPNESDVKLCAAAASFLGMQMEE